MTMRETFEKLAGKGSVSEDPKLLSLYAEDHSYSAREIPAMIIRPGSAGGIQPIVAEAGRLGLPLVPVSSSPKGFRGDTVPSLPGSAILDLSGLDRVMSVDRRNRVALAEAGVTFGVLQKELMRHGLRAMIPLCPRAGKSVAAAYMDREPFTVPRYSWDLGDPIASAELVLGDGRVVRTGGAAGPGRTLDDQKKVDGAQKLPMSPMSMDIRRIAQGSLGSIGIASWISLRCELAPEYEMVLLAGADTTDALVAFMNRLLYLRLPDELYVLNRETAACLAADTPAGIRALSETLPAFVLVLSVCGTGVLARDQFEYKLQDATDEAARAGIGLSETLGGLSGDLWLSRVVRKVSTEPYWKLRPKGDVREVFFLTTLRRAPEFVEAGLSFLGKAGYPASNAGVTIQPVLQGGACHIGFDLFMTPKNVKKHKGVFEGLSRQMFGMGGYFSRPHGMWSDMVYPHYETFATCARGLKRIFDPRGILNPGKLCFKEA